MSKQAVRIRRTAPNRRELRDQVNGREAWETARTYTRTAARIRR